MFNPEGLEAQEPKSEVEMSVEAEQAKLEANVQQLNANMDQVESLNNQAPAEGWGSKVKNLWNETSDALSRSWTGGVAGALIAINSSGGELGSPERLLSLGIGLTGGMAAEALARLGARFIKSKMK